MAKLPTIKVFDVLIILIAIGIVILSAASVYSNTGTEARVLVSGSGQEWIFPLDAEEKLTVPGPLGITVVAIHGSEARVEASPCVNQICVAQGVIHKRGGWAACFPNGVFVLIEGGEAGKDEPDAMAW